MLQHNRQPRVALSRLLAMTLMVLAGCQTQSGQTTLPGLYRAQTPEQQAVTIEAEQIPALAARTEAAQPTPASTDASACPTGAPVPTELCKVSLPPYRIEPPDILMIDGIRMIPLPPYRIEPLDVLLINLAQPLPNQPINGNYVVSPEGRVNLGFAYGTVFVGGMTVEESESAIREHLKKVLNNPQVSVALVQIKAIQQTRGEHLVGPDGTINLGTYGDVYVAGMTRAEAKLALERHLARFLLRPEVSVSVFAYNSKVYYVITDGGGYGQQVYRFPSTGNETVLDAISNIAGLPAVASKRKIWVARPAPPYHDCDQVLPVNWNAIVEGGSTGTNYQVFPGDRIYVKADSLIAFDNRLAKLLAPVERLLGITLLGSTTVNSIRLNPNATFGGGGF